MFESFILDNVVLASIFSLNLLISKYGSVVTTEFGACAGVKDKWVKVYRAFAEQKNGINNKLDPLKSA